VEKTKKAKSGNRQSAWSAYGQIVLGVAVLALAIVLFFEPYDLVFGGATGLGIIVRALGGRFDVEIPLWLTNLAINVPLFAWAWKVKGFTFLKRTGFATLALSACLYAAGFVPPLALEGQLPLAAVFGGVMAGFGLGLVFRNMATTGGSDLASMIVRHYHKHMQLSKLMLMIDAVVIGLGLFIFGPVKALYAIAAVYASSKAIGAVLEGMSYAKAAFVISEKGAEVSAALLAGLKRGGTVMDGRGMYTGAQKNVFLCVVSSKEIVQVKEIVARTDADAFVLVADVREVMGEGFAARQN